MTIPDSRIKGEQIMATLTCPLGHTEDAKYFHKPVMSAMGGDAVFLRSVVVCPKCKVLFRRSLSEQATEDRLTTIEPMSLPRAKP